MTLPYRQDLDLCLAEKIGKGGLGKAALPAAWDHVEPAVARLRKEYERDSLPLLRLPGRRGDLSVLGKIAAEHAGAGRIVVLGTGGSSLGGRALCEALAAAGGRAAAHPVTFLDDIDPDNPELSTAGAEPPPFYLVISKSGATAETVAQFLAMRARLEAAAEDWADRLLVITEPGDSPLRRLVARDGIAILDHEPGLGGRFSVLSNVGLLPLRLAGGDPAAVRAGAGEVLAALMTAPSPRDWLPAQGAALNQACANLGHSATVLMSYSERMDAFGLWFRQLWAESLGKGGHGTTPLAARGTVDQHSQLQLWLDGPADKLVNVITFDRAGTGPVLEGTGGDPDLAYLAGRTLGDLLDAEQRATIDALAARGRPVRVFHLPRLDARAMGALMMHFMLETILTGYAQGIDPFDQPAVEEGKVLARKYLADK